MKILKIISVLLLALVLNACSNNIDMDKSISNIDERRTHYLNAQLQDNQFPGIQYVVFNKDKIIYQYSGGMAKIQSNQKMTANSVLNVYSTTKVITGIAVLQLAQQGRLSLDDKLEKHFTNIPYKEVTIRQVLSHSSGIPNALLGNFYIHWADQHNNYERDNYLLSVMKDNSELNFTPGEEIGYTNMGYAILGKIIENVSGFKYEDYITKHIFNRLKLDKQKINFGTQQQAHSALPYFKRSSLLYNILILFLDESTTRPEGQWTAINKPFYFNYPSHGGIMASASEYAKIFMSLLQNEKSDLLSPTLMKEMFTVQKQYKDDTIAVSWFKGEMHNTPYFYHQGSGMGYVAEVRLYPEKNMGSILLMNRSDMDGLSMINTLDAEFIKYINAENKVKAVLN